MYLAPWRASAQERILSYDSEVQVNADGSITWSNASACAEGQHSRGITRDFPTRYKDRHGNRVVVDFEMRGVERDGKPEPWFIEQRNNGVRINTGNDDFLPVPGEFTFTLRYSTTRQLGFFDHHDELYWNAIGTGSGFLIESGSAEVRLPQPVPTTDMTAEGYTGAQGAASGFARRSPASHAGACPPLAPREGFTRAVLPEGTGRPADPHAEVVVALKDNAPA